ncbi:hypothetical protein [Haloferax sulfurifontis]|uniref:Uncharacterized protein n=2 Tax=Haloferax sulfurifontis TaxID=255616 RepID=M0IIL7_9EURY|nr:hypothetical protein [Haloferax sulfurifontis]ELZ96590.1 hypothetical protein C441_04459 [Haloferax sulfurifontis ATCC BAA-897]GGC72629.1 hypothetical protein GCM10007209_38230 [Haloferax sulfurifontis]
MASRVRQAVRATYRERREDVEADEIAGDVAVGVVFPAIGLYGLYATGTTPTTTTMGFVGALAVAGIELALLYFGVLHAIATWNVYRRSEPTHQHGESYDGFAQSGEGSE